MPSVPQIIAARRTRQQKQQHPWLQGSVLTLLVLTIVLTVIALLLSTLAYTILLKDLPAPEALSSLLDPPHGVLLHPTRFLDRSGQHVLLRLENPAVQERVSLSYDEIPTDLANAFIAALDPTFWTHPGFHNLSTSPSRYTLAEQLVRDLLLWDEPDGTAKLWRQRLLAAQITHRYGREKVLQWYLNSAYFGEDLYGVAQAAEAYFGKPVSKLSLLEAASLAAVAEAPAINPHNAPNEVGRRALEVVDAMLAQGLITAQQARAARRSTLEIQPPQTADPPIAGAYLDLVWEQLAQIIPPERLRRGGFDILTSLDFELQQQVRCTRQIFLAQETGDSPPAEECAPARLLPTPGGQTRFPAGSLQAAVLILDPATGQVLAMDADSPLPFQNPRPTGSLLTPFLYLTAFTRGFNPATLLWDIPGLYPEEISRMANPQADFLGPMRLRTALATDALIPALNVLERVGALNFWRTLERFGITLPRPSQDVTAACAGCAWFLEEGESTLTDAVSAYAALANRGSFAGDIEAEGESTAFSPVTLLAIRGVDGARWYERTASDVLPITSEQLAYLINHMLSDEAARWPRLGHPNLLEIGRPVAVKTGATVTGRDAWAIGYTSQLVVGVWVGAPEEAELPAPLSYRDAAGLWRALSQYALRDLPSITWEAPPGISILQVCDPSGLLPGEDCPSIVSEVFLSGHEPTQMDTLFRRFQINRETGRLATVFTPPELIEERVYMMVPPEAREWARQAGITLPPQAYDVIYMPTPSPTAVIQSPQIFSSLRGEVEIRGTAAGEDFVSYRLQIGEGVNPQSWLALGETSTTPVRDGLLGRWDTSGLNGLYALQLIVLRQDQRVDTHTIQVTVDNLPPEVTVRYPEDGATLEYSPATPLTFQVQAEDNLGLREIRYALDGETLETQTQPPFAYPWSPHLGDHTLTITAIDLAGNMARQSITFSITP